MGTPGFDPNVFGPFGAIFQNYLSAFDPSGQARPETERGTAPAFDPQVLTAQMTGPLKAVARCQLEVLGLVNRRIQAQMQVPTRLAQCRSPQDFMNEQMVFWRTAAEQYADSASKIGESWMQAFSWVGAAATNGARVDRDYINFSAGDREEVQPRPQSAQVRRSAA